MCDELRKINRLNQECERVWGTVCCYDKEQKITTFNEFLFHFLLLAHTNKHRHIICVFTERERNDEYGREYREMERENKITYNLACFDCHTLPVTLYIASCFYFVTFERLFVFTSENMSYQTTPLCLWSLSFMCICAHMRVSLLLLLVCIKGNIYWSLLLCTSSENSIQQSDIVCLY